MPGHPCERGRRCSCHRAGPSTRRKKTTLLAAAALVCPVLAAPTPTNSDLPFLYPSLERRAKDAGQAPDDPSEGFTHQHIQLADLIRAGLPYKYVYDSSANVSPEEMEEEMRENGAWVIDNAWSLHGRRFGPLYATATVTAGITDDPLPTPTESIPPASTPTLSTTPTVLAIQSTLPTGWDATPYARSNMYAIPLVVSFSLVIALMIGSLIGALVIRRDRSRSRRRKKRIIEGDDDSIREKVVQSSLVSRVGRALKHREQPDEPEDETELEHRVKTWARRSAAWRAQARIGVRRRMTRGRKRSQADPGPGPMGGAIQEEPEPEEEGTRLSPAQSRAPTPVDTRPDLPEPTPGPAPNYASPTVPNYVTPTPTYSSPDAGPSTPLARTERPDPLTRIEAHPDATPSDEPAYDGPGSGDGLPPAYRGGGLSEVARGKRPAHISEPAEAEQERRVWTELDAYAYGQRQTEGVTAHVATDDKRVLERLHLMRGAPDQSSEQRGQAPREEDVFGSAGDDVFGPASGLLGTGSAPSSGIEPCAPPSGTAPLPLPPTKTGTGPVARYGEADLCLPRYLDGEGMPGEGVVPGEGMGMVPSVPPGEEDVGVPSAPPCHETDLLGAPCRETDLSGAPCCEETSPSAPPCREEMVLPSAPVFEDSGPVPSAPPIDDHLSSEPSDDHFSPMNDRSAPSVPAPVPSAPTLDDHSAPPPDHSAPAPNDHLSAPLHDDTRPDGTRSSASAPQLRRLNSSCPLLGEEQ